jgi:hypothetical protein
MADSPPRHRRVTDYASALRLIRPPLPAWQASVHAVSALEGTAIPRKAWGGPRTLGVDAADPPLAVRSTPAAFGGPGGGAGEKKYRLVIVATERESLIL